MALKVLIPFCFSVWIFLEAVNCEQVSHACYGTDPVCDHYTIECPDTYKIQLGDLYVGYKTNQTCTEAHCDNYNECCITADGDTKEFFNKKNTYDTYSNCSGKQQCTQVHAPWQLMTLPIVPSTFVELGFSCVREQNTISMCESETVVTNSTVDIMYEGSRDTDNRGKTCQCDISSSGQVNVTLVDIRLESFYKDVNQSAANCSSALLSTSVNHSLECREGNKHYEVNFIYSESQTVVVNTSQNVMITLKNIFSQGQYDAPVMVWIALQGSNDSVRVSCGENTGEQETTEDSNNAIRHCNTTLSILMYCLFTFILHA